MYRMYQYHGFGQKDRIYRIWVAMRQRCSDPNRSSYATYGGRGVRVCTEWDESFVAFKTWADASGYADDLSIDRIDPSGNYEPGNCRWATAALQAANRSPMKNHKFAEYQGETLHLSDWARRTGIGYTTLMRRFNSGKRGDQLFAPVA